MSPSESRVGEALAALRRKLPAEAIRQDEDALDKYGRDETESFVFPPDLAVLPDTVEQVCATLETAHEHRVPIVPRGAGTGLSGGALPVEGGWVLSLERLNRIRRFEPDNLLIEAEAGVVTGDLQRHAQDSGLYYPPDPASHDSCLLGGNLAEDSAGPRSCKYGSTRKWVLGLEAVLADGTVLRTGSDARKDVAGYNLTQLLVGSEGTLAVITAAVLRLIAQPRSRLTLILPFGELAAAAHAVAEIFLAGHDPAACEFVEQAALAAVAPFEPVPKALAQSGAALFLELHGDSADTLLPAAAEIDALFAGQLSAEALVATDASEQRRLWRIRERIGEAVKSRSSYKEADAVVPRGSLAGYVASAHRIAERCELTAICYGHAGDGNLHVNLLQGNLQDDLWRRRRDRAEEELFELAASLGGTVSGEHGIGWTQRRHLAKVATPAALSAMAAIKQALDPRGILNPGKVFPEPGC
ncbi:MAG: FAD-binding oxidoreductase [bacterium]|nr:FAD-binding oxidoreductase [bacterium]